MSLFAQLKRRNVIRVGVAYLVAAWFIIEISSVVMPIFGAPDWILRALTFLLAVSALPVLFLSWAYEVTPDGIKRDEEVADSASSRAHSARRLDVITIVLVIAGIGLLAAERFLWSDPTSRAITAEVTERSIAVIPFANRSAATDEASFFADGIHDDLLTNLSKLNDLQVISRTSVERYRDTELSIPQIAAELGVATILEGGVQRAGDRVRINVQLIDAATDQHLWAETYDEQLTTENLFEIQRTMALRIAEALATQLSVAETEALDIRPTDDLAAYEAYQQGRDALRTRNVTRMPEAIEHFQRATALDPQFALAYVGLADALLGARIYASQGYAIADDALGEVEPYINQALALDPTLASAYVALGIVNRRTERYEIAELALRRALDLSPGDARALHEYGSLLLEIRRIDTAVEYLQRAAELAPLDARVLFDVAAAHEAQGDLDEALRLYQRAHTINPNFSLIPSAIAWLYWDGYGRLDQAYPWQLKAIEIDPDNPGLYATMSDLFTDLGGFDTAMSWLDEAAQRVSSDEGAMSAQREILIASGRLDEAEQLAIAASHEPSWRGLTARRLIAEFELHRGETTMAAALAAEGFVDPAGNPIVLIDNRNDRNALRMAYLMKAVGQTAEPERLAAASRAIISSGAPHGPLLYDIGYSFAWVENHLVMGDADAAMAALREAVDSGWRSSWRYLEFYNVFRPLWDRPDFQALIAELEAEMAEQREAIRAAGG